MRQPARKCKSVDIELPLRPCAGIAHAQEARKRDGRFACHAVAGAILAAIAGCATHDTNPARQFRVEPVLRVSNAVQSTEASQAYCTLGRYFDGLHEWSRAVDAWRQAVAADSGNVEALDGLGVALAQGRRFAEAEATLRQAVALTPERARVRNNLGYVLLLEGRPQEAMAELRVAVSRDSGYAVAQANLREAMLRSGIQPDVAVATAAAPATAPADVPPPARGALTAPVPPLAAASTPPERVEAPAPAPATAPATAPDTATATAAVLAISSTSMSTATATATAAAAAEAPVGTATTAQPEATATPGATAEATAAPLSTPSAATDSTMLAVLQGSRLEVSNGNGIAGMAARVGSWLAARGMPTPRLTNQQPYAQRQTVILFRAGHEEAAHRLASLLPASARTAPQASPELRSDIRVVLGRDWTPVARCLARASCQPAAPGTTPEVAAVVAQR